MISRVAESCFWMQRYLERAEATTRLLEVNRVLVPDAELDVLSRWRPMVVVAGEEHRFREAVGAKKLDDGDAVQHYLVWDSRCPVSLRTSLYWARENARSIREILSTEFWEALNTTWIWFQSGKARYLFSQRRGEFYRRLRLSSHQMTGSQWGTLPVDEPFQFMQLGGTIERAGQTARLLDVRHHLLRSIPGASAGPEETAQALAVLRTCSAEDVFFRRPRAEMTGRKVASFLLYDRGFPRAVAHCLERVRELLGRIAAPTPPSIGAGSRRCVDDLGVDFEAASRQRVEADGVHAELTRLVEWTHVLTQAIEADYFHPEFESAAGGAAGDLQ